MLQRTIGLTAHRSFPISAGAIVAALGLLRVAVPPQDDSSSHLPSQRLPQHLGRIVADANKLRKPAGLTIASYTGGQTVPAEEAAPTQAAAAAPDLKLLYAQAPNLKVEDICDAVRTVTVSGRYTVPNPDGKTYDLLQIYFKKYGGPNTIAIMDLGTGTARTLNTGKNYWNFHLAPHVLAPNGKLYLSVLDGETRQQMCVYDPGTDVLNLGAIAMPPEILGESHPMVLGEDKQIYCAGTHPSMSVTAVQINPETEQVTFYGPIGPSHSPAPCWAYSMGVDNRYIYIASGKTPWHLVAFDRRERKSEVLITNDKPDGYIGVEQESGGASCFVRTRNKDGTHTDVSYWLWGGKVIPMAESKPWPAPPPAQPRPPLHEISGMSAAPDINGEAVFWYRQLDEKVSASAGAVTLPAAGVNEEGEIAALPSDEVMRAAGWKALRYNVEMYSLRIDRLIELPDGRVMGTAGHYQGNFFYDPRTGEREHPGICGLSHYSTVIHAGKVYMSGYPNGPLYSFDPSLPWTANKPTDASERMHENDPRSNPRRLTHFRAAGAKKMLAGAFGNGKVFFGGAWMREGSWGGLGWWNIQGGKEGGTWEPFRTAQIRSMAAADGGRMLVISTLPVANHSLNLPRPAQASLFFFDTGTETVLPQTLVPVPNASCTGPLVAVGGRRVIGWTENPENPKESSILYGIDAVARKVLFKRVLPFPISMDLAGHQWEDSDFRLGPDSRIWTFLHSKLARINPHDGSVEFVGSAGQGGRLAFSGKDLYLGGTERLRRIQRIVGN